MVSGFFTLAPNVWALVVACCVAANSPATPGRPAGLLTIFR